MTDILYLFLLYPLERFMQWCLEGAYALTQSYGLAIVLLSVSINFLLLPLYTLAESWQQKERKARELLAPGVRHIKAAFKGQERFAMLRTLYRQHDYHPVNGLRASLGLFIQIPFFLAAYNFLRSYEPLQGIDFLWFSDLALPDASLTIAGTPINLMPLLMTAINLCSAHVYGQTLRRGERIQLYALAALFLVFLYNAPVALVLYWTVNNLFSLGRGLISRKLDTVSPPTRLIDTICRIHPTASQTVVVVALLAISIATLESGIRLPSMETPLTAASFALLLYLSLAAAAVHFRSRSGSLSITNSFRPVLIVVLSVLVTIYSFDALSAHQRYLVVAQERRLVWLGFCLISGLFLVDFSRMSRQSPLRIDTGDSLFFLSHALVFSVICIFAPISLYVSDPTLFSVGIASILLETSFVGAIVVCVLCIIYYATNPALRGYHTLLAIFLAVTICLYVFVFVGDFGSIDFFTLDKAPTARTLHVATDVLTAAIVATMVIYAIRNGHCLPVYRALLVVLVTTLLVSGYQLHGVASPLVGVGESTDSGERVGMAPPPAYTRDLFAFSRGGKNIVIIMLDAFNAYTLPKSLMQDPDLRTDLDGFTWYRNTLTAGTVTILGEPGIHGGHRYTPLEMAKRDYGHVSDEIARSYQVFSESFAGSGFDVSYAGVQNVDCDQIAQYSRSPPLVCVNHSYAIDFAHSLPWPGQRDKSMLDGAANVDSIIDYPLVLMSIGLFRAAPFFLKKFVYDNGTWLNAYPRAQKNLDGARRSAENLAGLGALSAYGTTDSEKDTFKYIQNDLTHRPYYLDPNTCLPSLQTSTDETARDCALAYVNKWLRWLKDNEVYDNTMIVLVSDHGSRKFGYSLGMPLSRANALLMVKDFNARGPLATSDTFMSNADVPAIVCTTIGGCAGVSADPRQQKQSRTLYMVRGKNTENYQRISDSNLVYQVKDNIFDSANWKIID